MEYVGKLGEKVEGIKPKKTKTKNPNFIDTDSSMVITRGKGVWGEVEEGKGEINDDGRRLDLV